MTHLPAWSRVRKAPTSRWGPCLAMVLTTTANVTTCESQLTRGREASAFICVGHVILTHTEEGPQATASPPE